MCFIFWRYNGVCDGKLNAYVVAGAFLIGFGLSEIPKGIWINVYYNTGKKFLSHKVNITNVKLDDSY